MALVSGPRSPPRSGLGLSQEKVHPRDATARISLQHSRPNPVERPALPQSRTRTPKMFRPPDPRGVAHGTSSARAPGLTCRCRCRSPGRSSPTYRLPSRYPNPWARDQTMGVDQIVRRPGARVRPHLINVKNDTPEGSDADECRLAQHDVKGAEAVAGEPLHPLPGGIGRPPDRYNPRLPLARPQ